MPFEFKKLEMDLILIKSKVFQDNRGYLKEIFKNSDFQRYGIPIPIQSNVSFSKKGVIRGLHYQLPPKEQGKIITVIKGRIFDVALDIRRDSKTFGKYFCIELSEENHYMLYIPPGFAHGFQALEDSIVFYFITHNEYTPNYERCIHYSIIDWPLKENIITSEKDSKCPKFGKAEFF
jgi:dTDP-4-dehydrorhamnose 3,5-epimerase